jgi:outer membrane protein OmpA-like peptidoglycan-associated protein
MRATRLLVAAVLLVPAVCLAGSASMHLDRTSLLPGQELTVTFAAPDGLPDGAWIGLIPSSVPHGDEAVNDQNDVAYEYLGGKTSGSFTFKAPGHPGSYDLRMNDGNGKEIASVSFAVKTVDASAVTLKLSAATVAPGAAFTVTFTAPPGLAEDAWVGIIPSSVPHGDGAEDDRHDVAYEYVSGRTSGSMAFEAPGTPGSWDARFIDTAQNGTEIASVTFEVRALGGATLSLDRTKYAAGEDVTFHFTAPAGFAKNAWVGVVPSSVPHGDEEANDRADLGYVYLEGRTAGELTLQAPTEGGSYDLRMNDTDQHGREVASVTFTVTSDVSAEDMAATLAAKGKLALYGIHFATDSAEITKESAKQLAQVGQLLIRDPGLKLTIEGHTDSTGNADHNLELSQRRAESVKTYLVDTFGIEAARLTTRGLGATVPVADNSKEAGRALNRRVELVRQD